MAAFDSRSELVTMFRKYLKGTATPEEKLFVEAWYLSYEHKADVLDGYAEKEVGLLEADMEATLKETIRAGKLQAARLSEPVPSRKTPGAHRLFYRFAAAAALVLCVLGGYFLWSIRSDEKPSAGMAYDLSPGTDRGMLTLSDGMQIVLDSTSAGVVAREGTTLIRKTGSGLITYSGEGKPADNRYNTISAPAGGKYSIVLPDGSKAWLNSESSIRFPTAFQSNQRRVTVAGEVYFEIARDVRRPFIVNAGGIQEVKVLGTHFNVNAYGDNGIVATTLLEGSVEVSTGATNRTKVKLKPGEQAASSGTGTIRVREHINTEEIMAWKNGLFQFEQTDLVTVMRQLSRWYDVEVAYEGGLPDKKFSGKISRNSKASEALEILRFTGVNFRIETLPGNKKNRIVVTP